MKNTNELIEAGRKIAENNISLDLNHHTTIELIDHAMITKAPNDILTAVWDAYYLGLAVGNNAK